MTKTPIQTVGHLLSAGFSPRGIHDSCILFMRKNVKNMEAYIAEIRKLLGAISEGELEHMVEHGVIIMTVPGWLCDPYSIPSAYDPTTGYSTKAGVFGVEYFAVWRELVAELRAAEMDYFFSPLGHHNFNLHVFHKGVS